ncbi:MAG: ShlB/FhaC/HecB family hemolysin secretion/activation protein [Janthinobacterium lividum]
MNTAAAQSAATPPGPASGDEFLRQQERERVLREQLERRPDGRLPALPTPADQNALLRLPEAENNCVPIDHIRLTGDAADQFQWALAAADRLADGSIDRASGRCLGSNGINLVMRRIRNAIVARGFVTAQVLAGAQDRLGAGQLELTLFPGRIHAIRFADDADPRATKWNAFPAKPGDLLNLRDIEQALENFKRVPSVEADIELVVPQDDAQAQNMAPGQSDVVIHWKQGLPFRLSLSADDSGTRATGKYQGNLTLSLDHWWTLNDLFYLSINHNLGGAEFGPRGSHGTHGYTAHYSLPFGYWLLGLTSSSNLYHQTVAGASQNYVYRGESQTNEVRLSRLVYRDSARSTTLWLRGWNRNSKNFIDDTEVEVQRRRMAGLDFGITQREFIGAATLDIDLSYRRGTGALDALRAPEEAFGEGTSRPRLFNADARFSTPFLLADQRWRYTAAWRAQWNKTPLVPQDRFLIGGRYSVRGFDGENQLVAERGWLLRNDLGLALGQSGQELYLGIDYGKVAGAGTVFLPGDHLSGAVLGLRGWNSGVSYDVFIGQPLSKPNGFSTSKGVAGFMINWSI